MSRNARHFHLRCNNPKLYLISLLMQVCSCLKEDELVSTEAPFETVTCNTTARHSSFYSGRSRGGSRGAKEPPFASPM